MGTVQFKITNNSNESSASRRTSCRALDGESKSVPVLRDGKPVDYLGKMVKRARRPRPSWSASSRTRRR